MVDYKQMDQILKDCTTPKPKSWGTAAVDAIPPAVLSAGIGLFTGGPVGAVIGAGIGGALGAAGSMIEQGAPLKKSDGDACVGRGVKKLLGPPSP